MIERNRGGTSLRYCQTPPRFTRPFILTSIASVLFPVPVGAARRTETPCCYEVRRDFTAVLPNTTALHEAVHPDEHSVCTVPCTSWSGTKDRNAVLLRS